MLKLRFLFIIWKLFEKSTHGSSLAVNLIFNRVLNTVVAFDIVVSKGLIILLQNNICVQGRYRHTLMCKSFMHSIWFCYARWDVFDCRNLEREEANRNNDISYLLSRGKKHEIERFITNYSLYRGFTGCSYNNVTKNVGFSNVGFLSLLTNSLVMYLTTLSAMSVQLYLLNLQRYPRKAPMGKGIMRHIKHFEKLSGRLGGMFYLVLTNCLVSLDPKLCICWIVQMLSLIHFKNHKRFIQAVKTSFEVGFIYFFKSINITGIRFTVYGKLGVGGSAKTRAIKVCVGCTAFGSRVNRLEYAHSIVRTQSGVLGLDLFIFYR